MNELIKVNTDDKGDVIVSGRELHEFLESKEPYTQWFERMKEYGFVENVDFSVFQNFVNDDTAFGGLRKITEHAIKLDMAKEIAMIQRNDKGKQARQYFIAVEKEYNSPEKIMARALRIADETINNLKIKIQQDKPKVLFADSVESSNNSCLVGELAKILKQNNIDIGQNKLFEWLREKGYLIKQKGENFNLPTQYSMELGLMTVKKSIVNNPDGTIRTTRTPKITGKGQIYFVNKFLKNIA
nr:MAG TPA: KilAC domain protein [Caudoviricetes sp.]